MSAENHPGAVDSLTDAAMGWATPRANEKGEPGDHGDADQERMSLTGQAELMWAGPQSGDSIRGIDRKSRDWKRGQGSEERNSPDLDKVAEYERPGETSSELGHPDPEITLTGLLSLLPVGFATSRRRLNPEFVEWLMEWPENSTSISPALTDSGSLGTV